MNETKRVVVVPHGENRWGNPVWTSVHATVAALNARKEIASANEKKLLAKLTGASVETLAKLDSSGTNDGAQSRRGKLVA